MANRKRSRINSHQGIKYKMHVKSKLKRMTKNDNVEQREHKKRRDKKKEKEKKEGKQQRQHTQQHKTNMYAVNLYDSYCETEWVFDNEYEMKWKACETSQNTKCNAFASAHECYLQTTIASAQLMPATENKTTNRRTDQKHRVERVNSLHLKAFNFS